MNEPSESYALVEPVELLVAQCALVRLHVQVDVVVSAQLSRVMETFAAFLKLATLYHSKSMSPWVLNFNIIMRSIAWHVINSSNHHSTYWPYTYMASLQCGSTCDTRETCEFWIVFHRHRKRTCHIKETLNIIYACGCNIHTNISKSQLSGYHVWYLKQCQCHQSCSPRSRPLSHLINMHIHNSHLRHMLFKSTYNIWKVF